MVGVRCGADKLSGGRVEIVRATSRTTTPPTPTLPIFGKHLEMAMGKMTLVN